jgi:hypothetical protein
MMDPETQAFIGWLGEELERFETLENHLAELVGGRPSSQALHAIAADVHLLALNRELEEKEEREEQRKRGAQIINLSDRRRR